MRVRVLFFGVLKEIAGRSDEELDLPAGALVRDLLDHYAGRDLRMRSALGSVAVAVKREYAGVRTELKDGDEVGLLPPVSGGIEGGGETPPRQPAGRRRYVNLVRTEIDTSAILAEIKCGEDGAAVVFEGVVRNQTRGRRTLYLLYEAYEEMALRQMEELAERALREFEVRDVALVHRLGRLEIGETSVLIVVASAHRAAGFEACRWLIDTLKKTVPIWKKEFFADGAVWVDGEGFPEEVRANFGGPGSTGVGGASK